MKGYKRFKAYLVEHDIQQGEVANMLEISRARFNMILNGKRGADFTGTQIKTLCDHYHISADTFFFRQ